MGAKGVGMSWPKEEAGRINEDEKRFKLQQEWQLHSVSVVRGKAPIIWEQLVGSLEADLEEFNHELGNQQMKINHLHVPSRKFQAERTFYPELSLELKLNGDAGYIEWERHIMRDPTSVRQHEKGRFELRLEKDGEVYLRFRGSVLSTPAASKMLLQPILSS
jgi:hypothetical protein